MFGLQSRVVEIERRLRKALQDIADLFARMAAAENQKQSPGAGVGGGGGGAAGAFFADNIALGACPAGLLSTFPTPPSATAAIYQISGGAFVLVTASGNVYNGLPTATDGTKRQILLKNADGSYTVVAQSCL